MNISPEFQRNIWLELTLHRLIAMPAVLGGIVFIVYLAASNTSSSIYPAFSATGFVLFFLITIFWGTRLAAESISSEIRDRTWDMQRMTAISAWQMTWGKLFGSTIFTWYGALISLAVYLYGAIGAQEGNILKHTLLLIGTAVLVQAYAMLTSLVSIQHSRTVTRTSSTIAVLLGIIVAFNIVGAITQEQTQSFQWYGSYYQIIDFVLASVLVFCFWAVFGVYRMLRHEFQYRNSSFVWLTFVLFLAFYLAGMLPDSALNDERILTARFFIAFMVTLALVYVQIFMQNKDPVLIRKLLMDFKSGNWSQLTMQLPAWSTTVMLSTLFGIILLFREYQVIDLVFDGMNVRQQIVALLLFVYRDIAIVIYFNIAASRKRSDTTAFIYLLILYFLLPGILSSLGFMDAAFFFNPFVPSGISVVGGLVQFAIISVLLVLRWRANAPPAK